MGLYVRRDEERSDLQKKIAADLREKSKKNSNQFGDIEQQEIDGVEDSGYIEGTKQSSSLLGVWVVLLGAGIATVIILIVLSN